MLRIGDYQGTDYQVAKREAHKISRLTCKHCGFLFRMETGLTECPYDGHPLKEIAFDPLIGMMLDGKYEIVCQIGSGGMSLVYKAKLRNGREVAVKTLQAYLRSDELTVLRFQQEIQAMSSLQHPCVVSIHDHGVTPENQPYLVMDFVSGKPLSRVIKDRGRLNWQEALPIFIQICDGLEAAHSCGIIHRDIKPGNIMIIQQGLAPMQARVVDFGIAKLMYGGGQRLTRTGEVIGSPLYMSPEQCTGDPLDHRTDMYALACVMHETLVGRPPLVGLNVADMMHMHLKVAPPSLSVARPDTEFPSELEEIILRMLSKRAEDRYDSLLTVREQLHALALRGGVYAPAVATFQTGEEGKVKRRGPGMLVEAALALLVVILLGTGVVFWGLPIAERHQMDSLYEIGLQQLTSHDYENARRSFDDALLLADQVHDNGVSQCRILASMSDLFERMASADRAERADEQISRVVRANTTGDLDVDRYAMATLGSSEEASASSGLERKKQLLQNIDYAVSMCLAKARPQIAEKLALRGLELDGSESASRLHRMLGSAYLAQEKVTQAEQEFLKATALKKTGAKESDAEQKRKTAAIATRAAHAFVAHGLDKQAQRFYTLALSLTGEEPRAQAVVMREFADYLKSIGEVHRAEELLAKANARRFPDK